MHGRGPCGCALCVTPRCYFSVLAVLFRFVRKSYFSVLACLLLGAIGEGSLPYGREASQANLPAPTPAGGKNTAGLLLQTNLSIPASQQPITLPEKKKMV